SSPLTTDFNVCSFRKNRVQVSSNCDQRSVRDPFSKPDDISFRIDFHIRQAAVTQHFRKDLRAFFLFERWRLDFCNLNGFLHNAVVISSDEVLRGLNFGVGEDALWGCDWRPSRDARNHQDEKRVTTDPGKQLSLRRQSQPPYL